MGNTEPKSRRRSRKSSLARRKEKEKKILEQVWSRKMALEGLKRIFETALEGARIEIRDENGALVEVKFNPPAANAATKAVETANRMLGSSAPEPEQDGEDADSLLSVDLCDAEDFAL